LRSMTMLMSIAHHHSACLMLAAGTSSFNDCRHSRCCPDTSSRSSASREAAYISSSTSHHFFSNDGGWDGRTDGRIGAMRRPRIDICSFFTALSFGRRGAGADEDDIALSRLTIASLRLGVW
jgi:hypothetical protein